MPAIVHDPDDFILLFLGERCLYRNDGLKEVIPDVLPARHDECDLDG